MHPDLTAAAHARAFVRRFELRHGGAALPGDANHTELAFRRAGIKPHLGKRAS